MNGRTLMLVIAVAAWLPCRAAETTPPDASKTQGAVTVRPGAAAPLFSAARLDGDTLSLSSLRGHVVLLDFWAVNCPPCRIEMPALEDIHRRYSDRGLKVVGITEMDPTPEEARRLVSETGVTYPILLDPGARIAALYGLEAHPTTFVIDALGKVRFVNSGYLKGEEKEIEQAVKDALAAGGTKK